jgi:hypothetical protein
VRLAARNSISQVTISIKPFKALGGDAVPFGELIDRDLVGNTPNCRELKRVYTAQGMRIAGDSIGHQLRASHSPTTRILRLGGGYRVKATCPCGNL